MPQPRYQVVVLSTVDQNVGRPMFLTGGYIVMASASGQVVLKMAGGKHPVTGTDMALNIYEGYPLINETTALYISCGSASLGDISVTALPTGAEVVLVGPPHGPPPPPPA